MAATVARALKHKGAFTSREEEVLLGVRIAAARIMEQQLETLLEHVMTDLGTFP